jgi:protease-4
MTKLFFRNQRSALIIILILSLGLSPDFVLAKRIRPNTVYVLNLKGTLIEYKEKDKFSDMLPALLGFKPNLTLGLNHILKNIAAARYNPKITGIFIVGGELKAGYGSLKEIRDALIDFKKSGKFILAYADNFSQSNFYLASVADKVMLNPYGTVDLKGLASRSTFYKQTLDKLGVEMQVVKVGDYKSAVEPYTRTNMSDKNREQVSEFLNSIWRNLSSEIAESRKITEADVNAVADSYAAVQPGQKLKTAHIVDTLVYVDQTDSILNSYSIYQGAKVNKIGHYDFTKKNRRSKSDKNKIAVIYANGTIGGNRGGIDADAIIRSCFMLEKNPMIKAVVLRVNSPGGSAFDSEKMWRALHRLNTQKPLVVSMGNYAASGGYYISTPARRIVAEPTTITGSIGIFGMFPNLNGLNNKAGLTYDGVKTNRLSDAYNSERPFTDEERALMQENINRGYDLFVKRCADGRKKTADEIKAIAGGRVWTGEEALKVGLIDELGGLNDAVVAAAQLAHIGTWQLMSVVSRSGNSPMLKAMEASVEEKLLQNSLGNYYDLYRELNNIQKQDRIQARLLLDVQD